MKRNNNKLFIFIAKNEEITENVKGKTKEKSNSKTIKHKKIKLTKKIKSKSNSQQKFRKTDKAIGI